MCWAELESRAMMAEPRITEISVEPLGLVELSGVDLSDAVSRMKPFGQTAFVFSRSEFSQSWWLPEQEHDAAGQRVKTLVPGSVEVLRVASDLAGIAVAIERLDNWPELPSQIVGALIANNAHVSAVQTAFSGLSVVVNGAFVRSHNVPAIVRGACYRQL